MKRTALILLAVLLLLFAAPTFAEDDGLQAGYYISDDGSSMLYLDGNGIGVLTFVSDDQFVYNGVIWNDTSMEIERVDVPYALMDGTLFFIYEDAVRILRYAGEGEAYALGDQGGMAHAGNYSAESGQKLALASEGRGIYADAAGGQAVYWGSLAPYWEEAEDLMEDTCFLLFDSHLSVMTFSDNAVVVSTENEGDVTFYSSMTQSSASAPATDPIKEAFESGRYLDVISLFESALSNPSASITEEMKVMYYASFDKYVEAACTKAEIAFGTAKDYNAAIKVLQGAKDAAGQYTVIATSLEKQIDAYMTMQYEDSINNLYQAGQYLAVAAKYEEAVFQGISVSDQMTEQYAKCFSKYVEFATAEAEKSFGSDRDYDAAIRTLSRYMEDAIVYYNVYCELEDRVYDYIAAKYAYLMEKAYQEGNYLEVARRYQEAANYDVVFITKTMQQQYEDSVFEYLKTVSDEAQGAFGSNKDYNAALRIVHSAKAETTDIPDILNELESIGTYYASYEPFALTKLSPVQKTEYIKKGNESFYPGGYYGDITPDLTRDVNNTYYHEDTVFCCGRSGLYVPDEGDAYLVYNLNYEFCTLTGVVYRPYIALSCDHSWKIPGVVKIYGDNALLWESPGITMDTFEAFTFSIDVSGVRNLKIEINGMWDDGNIPKVCVGNLMLQK